MYGPRFSRAGAIEPFDDGSNKALQNVVDTRITAVSVGASLLAEGQSNTPISHLARHREQARFHRKRIVTGSVKSVYQNHAYMNVSPTPKIRLANPAT